MTNHLIAVNKKAEHDYKILETFEAGIVLTGQEVKSIKGGHINLVGSYIILKNHEAWLIGAHVPPYKMAGPLPGYEPTRNRKLLLKKKELNTLAGKIKQKGLTLVPLKVYTKRGKIKLEFGLACGKKKYEKKEIIKKREIEKRIREAMKL
jgi:SsrA-binding protein